VYFYLKELHVTKNFTLHACDASQVKIHVKVTRGPAGASTVDVMHCLSQVDVKEIIKMLDTTD